MTSTRYSETGDFIGSPLSEEHPHLLRPSWHLTRRPEQNRSEKQRNNRCQVDCGKTIRVQIKSCNTSKGTRCRVPDSYDGSRTVRSRSAAARAATHRPDMIT